MAGHMGDKNCTIFALKVCGIQILFTCKLQLTHRVNKSTEFKVKSKC